MYFGEAIIDPRYRPVGQVRHTGELPLGEYCLLPQSLQFWHVYLHIVVGFEFVPRQRPLMASKALRSSGCSSAPPSHVSSPSPPLFIGTGMVMMCFRGCPPSRSWEGCLFHPPDHHLSEPKAPHST